MNKEKFYITTAIPYASVKPHFGNTFEVIMTDAIARYKKQRGYDVFFLTGTDEHGKKIETLAAEKNISPKEYADSTTAEIVKTWNLMNTTHDKFIRTTDDYHEKAVQSIFKKLYDKGDIYKDEYEDWYCTPCESFFTDTQLVEGKCPDCGRNVEKVKEETYYLRMTKYADRLIKHIEENPGFIEPESRKKEMLNNFLLPGLKDLCVSRTSFKWGVPVTFDPDHVIYVWIDALSNYITALGYNPENETQPELYNKYWPADVHIIGKDIVRFHTIYWPIILMALDVPLPKKVFGHPWFNFGADKMSKSKGNVIYADVLADKFTVDGVRYYALAEMPYANDGSITYENVVTKYNTDLVNNLGNLVKRTVSMNEKYFDSVIPVAVESTKADEIALDSELSALALETVKKSGELMDTYHIADALDAIFAFLKRANKYIDETTPWVLSKNEEDKPRLGSVIYNLLEVIRIAGVLLSPFIPATSEEIFAQLGTDIVSYESLDKFGNLKSGNKTGESKVLFARIDEEAFLAEIVTAKQAKLSEEEKSVPPKPEAVPEIAIDSFAAIELRSAQIIACEKVPKAKKLLKIQLDLGYEKRQVVSGIAKFYEPETLIGKKVIVVANLKPAILCGIESNGMILASGEEEVRVVFLSDETPLGERVR